MKSVTFIKFCKVPHALKPKLEKDLKRMVDLDTIEQIEKPSDWVNGLVIDDIFLKAQLQRLESSQIESRFQFLGSFSYIDDLNTTI